MTEPNSRLAASPRLALLVAGLTTAAVSGAAHAEDVIRGRPTRSRPSLSVKDSVRLTSELCRPAGSGPFPAVVLLHGCAGLFSAPALRSLEALLCDSGYVTLVVNSFSGRKVGTVCTGGWPSMWERVEDALAAKQYLASLPYVNPRRLGLVGWSHGAGTAVLTWARESREPPADPFAAVAAVYPYCTPEIVGPSSSPLLILTGDRDDWCPAFLCQSFVTMRRSPSRDISIQVYAGATHAFDDVAAPVTAYGHKLAPDAAAARDSQRRLVELFERRLKATD